MATAFRSIAARDAATLETVATVPANDNCNPVWMEDPRAKLLLASCVAHPPLGKDVRQRFGNRADTWFEYVGFRVECLTTIRDAIGAELSLRYQASGHADDATAFNVWCMQPSVTDAIDAARIAAVSQEG